MTLDEIGHRVRRELNPWELAVVEAIVDGRRNREIGDAMGYSENMVKLCVRKILDTCGVDSRLQLAVFALNHGIVQPRTSPALSLTTQESSVNKSL